MDKDKKIFHDFASMGEAMTKKKRWDKKMAEMLQPDVFGYVLDEGVRDLVVVLNLLEIHTTQSDQGNYGATPWVQFEAEEPVDVYVGESEVKRRLMKEIGILPEEIDQKSPAYSRPKEVDVVYGARVELQQREAAYTEDFIRWQNQTKELVEKLQGYIDEFYSKSGPANYADDHVAITYPYRDPKYYKHIYDLPFLEVHSVQEAEGQTGEEVTQIAKRRRKEMDRFTEFLKDKYFSS